MKRNNHALILLISIFLYSFHMVSGQDTETIDWLDDYRGEVIAGSNTYKYEYTFFNKELCGLDIKSIKTDKKGNESVGRNELYLSDIDEHAIGFKVSGKYITVSMETKSSQKFIRNYEDDEFKSYVSSIDIYTDQVDKARALINVFREKLEDCNQQNKSWGSLKESLGWMADNISSTTKGGTEYVQSFSFDDVKSHLAVFKRKYNDSKGNEITEAFSFNLADVDPAKVNLDVSGTDLSIELNTKNDEKYIRIMENGEVQNYDNDFEILVSSLEDARDIVQAFKYAIPLCKPVYQSYSDVNQALIFLKENIKEMVSGSYRYEQLLDYENKPDGMVSFVSKRTDSKGTTIENKYQLYLNELEPKVELSVSGEDVLLELQVKDNQKLIKTFKDGELQNYSNEFEIFTGDIESARELANAFNYAILNRDPGLHQWTDPGKASAWISSNVGTITISGESYAQDVSFDADNHYKTVLDLTTTDSDSETKKTIEFYIADINKDDLELSTSGKELNIEVTTGKEKLVKVTESDELQNYSSSIEFMFEDTRQARNFIGALKYLASNIKPSEKSFSDNQSAFKYISSNLPAVSTGTYRYDQTIEMIDDDPCRIKFSVIQLDSKEISTGFVYEFVMADINPGTVKLEISGKEMTVQLETKGRQKLIKPYKNGEPQNFDDDFEIFCNDVMVARNIVSAIKTMAGKCGK